MLDRSSNQEDRRKAPRFAADLPGAILWEGKRIACRVVDLSSTGARVSAQAAPALGARLELEIPKLGPVVATVVRISATHLALSFPGIVLLSPLEL